MAETITSKEMTIADRKKLTEKVMRTLKELIIDQENEKLRQQGADYEYVLVWKGEKKASAKSN